MIKATDVQKRFGAITAVDRVSFSVEKGEVLGFLGPNGAGKSTTMRMITGFLPLSGGKITIGDCDIEEDPVGAKRLFGYLPENAPAYQDMSVSGFLNFAASIRGLSGKAKTDAVARAVKICHLETVTGQTIDTLSKGYRHRVCFAQAILHDPPVLILDEPTDGLDPNQKHEMRELIREMGKNKAIIVSTHILEEVEAICTRVIIIDKGHLVFNGTPRELLDRAPRKTSLSLVLTGVSGTDAVAALEKLPKAESVKCRGEKAGDHPHGGGFPGTVGAEEAEHFPFFDREAHPVDGGDGAESLLHISRFYHAETISFLWGKMKRDTPGAGVGFIS